MEFNQAQGFVSEFVFQPYTSRKRKQKTRERSHSRGIRKVVLAQFERRRQVREVISIIQNLPNTYFESGDQTESLVEQQQEAEVVNGTLGHSYCHIEGHIRPDSNSATENSFNVSKRPVPLIRCVSVLKVEKNDSDTPLYCSDCFWNNLGNDGSQLAYAVI